MGRRRLTRYLLGHPAAGVLAHLQIWPGSRTGRGCKARGAAAGEALIPRRGPAAVDDSEPRLPRP